MLAVSLLAGWLGTNVVGALGNATGSAATAASEAANATAEDAEATADNANLAQVDEAQAEQVAEDSRQTVAEEAPTAAVGAMLSSPAGAVGSRSVVNKREASVAGAAASKPTTGRAYVEPVGFHGPGNLDRQPGLLLADETSPAVENPQDRAGR